MTERNSGGSTAEKLQMHEGEEITEIKEKDGRVRIHLESGWYFEFDEYDHETVFDLE